MLNRQGLEDAVVQALQGLQASQGAAVMPYPDRDFNRAAYNTLVLVGYSGDKFGSPLTFDAIQQDGEATVGIEIQAKLLRGHGSIYALLDEIQQTLTGLEFDGERFYCAQSDFLARDSSFWRYAMKFVIRTRYYENGETS